MVETEKSPTTAVGWALLASTALEWAGPGPSGGGAWVAGPVSRETAARKRRG